MRKRKWKQGIAVLTAAALVLTGITVPGSAGAKAKIRLNKKKVTIKVGGKVTLKLKNAKKKVIWKSSKKKVASVSAKGIVRGKSAGTAKITAKSNKKSYTCTVIVKEKRDSFVEPDETEMPGTTVPTAKPTGEPTKTPVNPTKAPVNPTKEPVDPTPEPTTAPTAAPSGNTLTIGKYSLSIGMSFQDAQNILGSKCVDEGISPQGYASYIYNPGNDYSCLVELQVKDGKLVELSTISKNFNYGDIAAAGNSIATLKANGFTAVETYKYTIYSKTSDQEYINVMTDAQRGGAVYGVQIFDKSLGSMDTLLYPKNCKYSDDINKYQARLTALYLNAYRAYHGAGLMQITDNGVAQAHSEYMASKNSDVMDEGSVSWKTRFDQNYNDGEKLFLKTEYVSYGSPDAFSAVTYAIAERDSTTNFYKYILMEEYEDEAVDFCIECGFANTASGSKLTFSAFDFYAY